MVTSGLLDGEPVELVDGLLVHVSPQGPEHAAVVQWLTQRFAARAELLRVQLPLEVPDGRPAPDLALAVNESARHHPHTAKLVVEIAVTSWDDDLSKLPGYAAAAIPCVWVINVPACTVHVFEHPDEHGYTSTRVARPGDMLTVPVSGIAAMPVSDLFAVLDR
jgi:Uma2 family endonuclease